MVADGVITEEDAIIDDFLARSKEDDHDNIEVLSNVCTSSEEVPYEPLQCFHGLLSNMDADEEAKDDMDEYKDFFGHADCEQIIDRYSTSMIVHGLHEEITHIIVINVETFKGDFLEDVMNEELQVEAFFHEQAETPTDKNSSDDIGPESPKVFPNDYEAKGDMDAIPNAAYVSDVLATINKESKFFNVFCEKLAIADGLINTTQGEAIQIIKNMRICGDCHAATSFISKIEKCKITVKDANRVHVFENGKCSCGDYF
ncbi:hypothetical protein L7F22_029872 [Adiantum nelumboides]|nr:hypothetical protein [Adiantum nelumboides]